MEDYDTDILYKDKYEKLYQTTNNLLVIQNSLKDKLFEDTSNIDLKNQIEELNSKFEKEKKTFFKKTKRKHLEHSGNSARTNSRDNLLAPHINLPHLNLLDLLTIHLLHLNL